MWYFPKVLQLFTKRVTEGLIDYYGMVPQEKRQKIRRSSSQ